MYKVEDKIWGNSITIGNGSEYLIIWVTINKFPYMRRIPTKKRKNMNEIVSNCLGYSIFKSINRKKEK